MQSVAREGSIRKHVTTSSCLVHGFPMCFTTWRPLPASLTSQSEINSQVASLAHLTTSWFGTMEYPECHICKMLFNGELQFSDHLKGRRHRKNLKKARRRQMELKLTVEPDDKGPPQGVEGQPVAILAQNSDNGRNYMDRDVSIEGIQNSGMWNVHDSPRKWVDDQGLPDGTTTEMVKNKTRGANEKREKEREETVARWRERTCMRKEDHPA